jgi:hypothetical protein
MSSPLEHNTGHLWDEHIVKNENVTYIQMKILREIL